MLGSAARSSPTTRAKTGRTAHVFTAQGGHTPRRPHRNARFSRISRQSPQQSLGRSPGTTPQHSDFPRQSSQQSPQQFWGIRPRGFLWLASPISSLKQIFIKVVVLSFKFERSSCLVCHHALTRNDYEHNSLKIMFLDGGNGASMIEF